MDSDDFPSWMSEGDPKPSRYLYPRSSASVPCAARATGASSLVQTILHGHPASHSSPLKMMQFQQGLHNAFVHNLVPFMDKQGYTKS
jgi:hypothetical protein